MNNPSISVIKRLFSVSGNKCAFPKCTNKLVINEKVVGKICHIKAASKLGPRYDDNQSDDERHGYDNLILLCPIHHDVVDSDVESYSVERLVKMKKDHELLGSNNSDISDNLATKFVSSLKIERIDNGSVIISNNQIGGQVAHTINNWGPKQREIPKDIEQKIIKHLSIIPPTKIGFASTSGNYEAHVFKTNLMNIFHKAGWNTIDMSTFMFFGANRGIIITVPFSLNDFSHANVIASALQMTGEIVAYSRGDMANNCNYYIQVWDA
jgi:hypothetical protein